jgi:hypothetical protein
MHSHFKIYIAFCKDIQIVNCKGQEKGEARSDMNNEKVAASVTIENIR